MRSKRMQGFPQNPGVAPTPANLSLSQHCHLKRQAVLHKSWACHQDALHQIQVDVIFDTLVHLTMKITGRVTIGMNCEQTVPNLRKQLANEKGHSHTIR